MVKQLHDICVSFIQSNLDRIPNVGSRLPTVLKELLLERIADHDLLVPEYIPYVTKELFCSSLRYITFYKCSQITDDVLCTLANKKCILNSITLHGCQSVTDKGIKKLLDKQDQLNYLRLRRLTSITSDSLTSVKSDKLETVDLTGCLALNVQGIQNLVNNNPKIKCLNIDGCHQLFDKVFTVIAKGLGHSLEELDGNAHVMSNESLKTLAKYCPNLRRLDLHGCSNIDGTALFELSQSCQNLSNLDLSYCNGLRKQPHHEYFWTLPTSLTSLSLCGILLDNESLFVECLQRLKRLKHIRLSGVPALNDHTFDQILQHIGKNLVSLDLSGNVGNTLTDEGIKSICKYCYSLEEIDFSLVRSLTLQPLIKLLQNPDTAMIIKKLFISTRQLSQDVLLAAAEFCKNVEKLDITAQKTITDDLLQLFAENCKKLHRIGLKGCSQITDEGICALARHCNLRWINLSGILNLTDKSVFCIANHCHNLEEIYMNGCTRISGTTVSYLSVTTKLPHLEDQSQCPREETQQKNLQMAMVLTWFRHFKRNGLLHSKTLCITHRTQPSSRSTYGKKP